MAEPLFTATVSMRNPDSKKTFTTSANAATRDDAIDLAAKKVKLSRATVEKENVSERIAAASLPTPASAGSAADGVIVLGKAGSNKRIPITINEMSTTYRVTLPADSNAINIAHADIVAFATAWVDSDGNSGYEAVDGYYVD